jgi:centromere protein J
MNSASASVCCAGIVEYFYAKADTWHTTFPEGVEVYHFPTGQTEAHHKGGLKEIIFPDGNMRLVHSQGAESDADLDMLSASVKRAKPIMGSM